MVDKALFTSNSTEWATPWSFIHQFIGFNFTLDVCATIDNAKAPAFYTKEVDGLKQDWHFFDRGGACWMNPPYGRDIGKWVEKAHDESLKGATVVCLLPSRTDTKYFHRFIWDEEKDKSRPGVTVRFLRGRIKFVGAKNSAPFPSMIVIFRLSELGKTRSSEGVV